MSTRHDPPVAIARHKTALTRYDLSKPVKSLLEYGILRNGMSFFDYGCGQGSDVKGLQGLGYQAEGWDPVFRPNVPKRQADIVNLGYVVNVIEDPADKQDFLSPRSRRAMPSNPPLEDPGPFGNPPGFATRGVYNIGVKDDHERLEWAAGLSDSR
jgi:hypothetical protein